MDKGSIEEYGRRSIDYFLRQEKASTLNIERSKELLGSLLHCHALSLGLFESTITKYVDMPGKTSKSISNRLALLAAFYQNIIACEDAIKKGYYFSAGALLRQEFEILCGCRELKKDLRTEGKVPNAKQLVPFAALYGDLSVLTHLSKYSEIQEILAGSINSAEGAVPTSLVPQIRNEICRNLYGTHILMICIGVEEQATLNEEMYDEEFGQDQQDVLSVVYKGLIDSGILVAGE